jgi:hypothetical protein
MERAEEPNQGDDAPMDQIFEKQPNFPAGGVPALEPNATKSLADFEGWVGKAAQ